MNGRDRLFKVPDIDSRGKAFPLDPLSGLTHEPYVVVQVAFRGRFGPLLPILFFPLHYHEILASYI